MNTDAPWPDTKTAWRRVLKIQTKLHQWATNDPGRRFDDLWNLVYDSAVLVEAWHRVRRNRGARTAGVDGEIAYYVTTVRGEQAFLSELRDKLKTRRFQPLPVREVTIPKPGTTKRRRLGIATVRDRVVQAALKLVLEPIFEVDFQPFAYGFRPERRAQDAVAEIHYYTSRSYEWIVEGDIKACFDEISHSALLQRVRCRIGRQLWLAGADDHQHQRVLVSIVALAAGDAGRHRDRVARTERALRSLTVLFQRAGHVTLQDKEHLLHVVVRMQRTLVTWRNDHRAKGSVSGAPSSVRLSLQGCVDDECEPVTSGIWTRWH